MNISYYDIVAFVKRAEAARHSSWDIQESRGCSRSYIPRSPRLPSRPHYETAMLGRSPFRRLERGSAQ